MRVKLDIPISLAEIALATGAKKITQEHLITAVCTDTREAQNGDLFIALKGERASGNTYIENAKQKGCFILSKSEDDGCIDGEATLLKLAEYYKSKLPLKHTVAVTGSVGKSTTVKFITRLLKEKYRTHSPQGNFNNHLGVPLTVLATPKDTEILITEFGMNHMNEISRLSKCVHPSVAVITAIGTAHLGNLGSRENIARAKLEILDGMDKSTLLVPGNEPLLKNISNSYRVERNSSLSSFSLDDAEENKYSFRSLNSQISDIVFFDKREHLLNDLAFAISVASLLDLSEREIRDGVRAINESDLRQRFILIDDFTVFDDSYNASLESVVADLKYITSMNRPTGAFLGDILELGETAHQIHERIGETAAQMNLGKLYLYGEYASDTERGAIRYGMKRSDIFINEDVTRPEVSIEQIRLNHSPGEIILFKASHRLRLDKIADIMKKG
jgi:UDP-N-acetylmuramoyl-tripeptide--D-alanyl-D-alanine ligase